MVCGQIISGWNRDLFFRIRSVFSGCPESKRRRVGPNHYLGPNPGAFFFRIRWRFFQDVLNKNGGGLGPAIISGPIRMPFFQDTLAFFRIRQPANVILRYAGVPSPGNRGSGLLRGSPQGLSQARFGGVFFRIRLRFFRMSRIKTPPNRA